MATDVAPNLPSAATTGLIVVSAIFPVLSAFALYLRIIATRRIRLQGVCPDETWLLISWCTTLPLSIVVWVVAVRSGIDYYTIDQETGVKYSLAVRVQPKQLLIVFKKSFAYWK